MKDSSEGNGSNRAFRGLFLVFLLSFLNFVGLLLTFGALGGIEPWSTWQFMGLFGVLEAGGGLANVVLPNIWHLPVAEQKTSDHTDVRLAATSLFVPHWGGLSRVVAALVLCGVAAYKEGIGPATITLVPLVLAIGVMMACFSAAVARWGVANPHRDVVQLVIRWNNKENELKPISMGASLVQFLLSIMTIPAVKLFDPSILYQPELGASANVMLGTFALTALSIALVFALWHNRIDWQAPPEQQREIEEHA